MTNTHVKIKRLHPDAIIPQYARPGDAGFDLVAVEDVIIEPGETKIVPTGLAFELPAGYELQVRPRSGISLKTKLRVQLGTVDAGYRGEVGVIVDNISRKNKQFRWRLDSGKEGSYRVRKGDRIAQGIIAPVQQAQFTVVDELGESERGEGGFGSSGVKSQ